MRLTFSTEHSWGPITEWHPYADLTIDLADGSQTELASISWRKQNGTSACISFQSDFSTFFGYYQRPNEGPIAYRGRRK